jgi:hypothetical protein
MWLSVFVTECVSCKLAGVHHLIKYLFCWRFLGVKDVLILCQRYFLHFLHFLPRSFTKVISGVSSGASVDAVGAGLALLVSVPGWLFLLVSGLLGRAVRH